jgi:hypothetical protein
MDQSILFYLNQANVRGSNKTPLTDAQIQALEEFFSAGEGAQFLDALDSQSAVVPGRTTLILWAGNDADGISMSNYAQTFIDSHPEAFSLEQTAAGQFLNDPSAIDNLVAKINAVFEANQLPPLSETQVWGAIEEPLWRIASENAIHEAPEIGQPFIGQDTTADSIFGSTEIPTAISLNKPIGDIPASELAALSDTGQINLFASQTSTNIGYDPETGKTTLTDSPTNITPQQAEGDAPKLTPDVENKIAEFNPDWKRAAQIGQNIGEMTNNPSVWESSLGKNLFRAVAGGGALLIGFDVGSSTAKAGLQIEEGDYDGAALTLQNLGARMSMGLIGAEAGAEAGAVLGSLFGPVGTAIGTVFGGITGAALGALGGQKAVDLLNQKTALAMAELSNFISHTSLGSFLEGMLSAPNGFWGNQFGSAAQKISPIILDLDGNGVTTVSKDAGVFFDLRNNGFEQKTGWVAPTDGLLVWDRNGNGVIDNGSELFGNYTQKADGTMASNGFDALASYDSNHDGVIDANDAIWNNLKIWQDANGNGITDPGELHSLSDFNIQSLNLNDFDVGAANHDAAGNNPQLLGTYTKTDGTVFNRMDDVNFATDNSQTIPDSFVPTTAAIDALPDLPGQGTLYSLHQAMARDTTGTLQNLVTQFTTATTVDQRNALLEQILLTWTSAQTITLNSRSSNGSAFNAQHLGVLEDALGNGFNMIGPGPSGSSTDPMPYMDIRLSTAYTFFSERMYAELAAQTFLKPFYDEITTVTDVNGTHFDFSAALADLFSNTRSPSDQQVLVEEFYRSVFASGVLDAQVNYAGLLSALAEQAPQYVAAVNQIVAPYFNYDLVPAETIDTTYAIGANSNGSTIVGGFGGTTIFANQSITGGGDFSNTTVYANAGNNTIFARPSSADRIYGGTGDDSIIDFGRLAAGTIIDGGAGNNNLEMSNEQSDIARALISNIQTLHFGGGTVAMTADQMSGFSLLDASTGFGGATIFAAGGGTYSLRNANLLGNIDLSAEEVTDGSVTLIGNDQTGQRLLGGWDSTVLIGGNGDGDVLAARGGQTTMVAGSGVHVTMMSSQGDNTFIAGTGNDFMIGAGGNNIFNFANANPDSNYTINAAHGDNGISFIQFGANVRPEDVIASRSGNDLVLAFTTDPITVQNYFIDSRFQVNGVEFADGTFWDMQKIESLVAGSTTALAQATINNPSSINFGNVRLGSAGQALSITNTGGAGAEYLDASIGTLIGDAAGSGSFSLLGTGQTDSTDIKVGIDTSSVGAKSGTVLLNFESDGTGVDTNGISNLGHQTIDVTGTVYREASASIAPLPTNLVYRVGDTAAKTLSITNTAANDGFSENLIANVLGSTGGVSASGSTGDIAAQANSNSLNVSISTVTAGAINGHITLGLVSDGTGIDGLGAVSLGQQDVAVHATVYREASALIAPLPASINFRVGDAGTKTLAVTNTAASDSFSENLTANVLGTTGSVVASGSTGNIAAQTTSNAISLDFSMATTGKQSGNVTLGLASDGTGVDGLGSVSLGQQTIAVNASVYREASASVAAVPSNPIVHVGDVVSENIAITNTAASDDFSENLVASVVGSAGGVNASGSTGAIAAQATNNSLAVNISTTAAGIVNGSVTLDLASDGTGVDGLGSVDLGTQTVAVNATVNNYAKAALQELSGGGAFTQNGNNYALTLNMGPASVASPDTALFNLGVLNNVAGPSDLLSGSFVTSGSSAFTLSGFTNFAGLNAGQSDVAPTVSFKATGPGSYVETITLHSTGSNTSGYNGALADETLTLTVNVGQTFNLSNKADTITGNAGNNVIVATSNSLSTGDKIDGGTNGVNTLSLQGAGNFDLRAPTTLTDIQTITAQEAITSQKIFLRDGLNATVNVASGSAGSTITIVGANNSDVINLGNGNDDMTLGSVNETVNAGTGNNIFRVTSTTIGAAIHAGTGSNLLDVTGGGSMVMGSNITGVSSVTLEDANTAYNFTANNTANLVINGSKNSDTISVGAASQTVNAKSGNDRIMATVANAGALINGGNGISTLEITTGGTAVMNANDKNLSVVQLDNATNLTLNGQSNLTALGSAGSDTIIANGKNQTLTGNGGNDSLIGSTLGSDTFLDTASHLNGSSITNFAVKGNILDITDLKLVTGTTHFSFKEDASNTFGTLTATDGTHNAAIQLFGQFMAAGFGVASDGKNGSSFTYTTPNNNHPTPSPFLVAPPA